MFRALLLLHGAYSNLTTIARYISSCGSLPSNSSVIFSTRCIVLPIKSVKDISCGSPIHNER